MYETEQRRKGTQTNKRAKELTDEQKNRNISDKRSINAYRKDMALTKKGKAFLPAWRCSLRLRLKQQEISTSSKRMTAFLRYKGNQKQHLKKSSELT